MSSNPKGRKTPQRGRLSDITNTTPLCSSNHRDDAHATKGCDTQLHKEVARLRKALAEKEELLSAQKVNMEKLWTNFNLKTKQNKDIIHENGSLYKELMQARDRLKILQHENVQMASAHKAIKSELQAKLAKALEQAESQKVAGLPTCEVVCDGQPRIPHVLARLAESRARRTISSYTALTEPLDLVKDESLEHSTTCRSTLRRRATLSYKEPSLKSKLRQSENINQVKSRQESGMQHVKTVPDEEWTATAGTMLRSTADKFPEVSLPLSFHPVSETESSKSTEDQNCLPRM